MKSRSIVCVLAAVAVSAATALADAPKQLENMHGTVAYQKSGAPARKPVAQHAIVPLSDLDYAITGAQSLGAVELPDSSRVLVGSESKVQMAFFNQAESASAKFLLYDGKIRFEVRHPQGAAASYTFQTPSASIAVRGTQGDIQTDPSGTLRVNVYEVCDASKPVEITTKDGQHFTLVPGQSLFAQYVNGRIQAQVNQITQAMIDQFSSDFGVPPDWNAAQQQIASYAQNNASSAVDNATGNNGIGQQVTSSLGGLFGKKKAAPTPSPSATPSTCS